MHNMSNPDSITKTDDVEDTCFAINYEQGGFHKNQNPNNKGVTRDFCDFIGVISLQSTTITDFHFGVLGGQNAILTCDKSSFINMRGTAIQMMQPRIMKMTSSVI